MNDQRIIEENKKRMREDLAPKQEGKKVVLNKDESTKITRSKYTGLTKARILTYTEDLKVDETDDTIFTISLGEDKKKFEEGVARIEIERNGVKLDALINIDVLVTVMRRKYAPTIVKLEEALARRQKMIRYINWFSKILQKIVSLWQKRYSKR